MEPHGGEYVARAVWTVGFQCFPVRADESEVGRSWFAAGLPRASSGAWPVRRDQI